MYCEKCGTELTYKTLEREGKVPYCPHCEEYCFPHFSVAMSAIVMNEERNRILLIQQYGKRKNILVAGYVNKGENLEETVSREIEEELGVHVTKLLYNKSQYYAQSNTLMVNYGCVVDSMELHINDEIDHYEWFDVKTVKEAILNPSLAREFLLEFLDNHKEDSL